MKHKPSPRFDGVHYLPISLQNLANQDERSPIEIMRGYPHAEEQADAIADEFITILNKYIDINRFDDKQNHQACLQYAMKLAINKVLSSLHKTL